MKISIFFTIWVTIALLCISPANSQTMNSVDKNAILDIWNSLTASSQTKFGWDTSIELCGQGGSTSQINCNSGGKVISLYITQAHGAVPTTVGQLTSLTALRLGFSPSTIPSEYGSAPSVPTEIGQLSFLTSLSLQEGFIGTIPTELFGLVSLHSLDFIDSYMTGTVPSELKFLPLSSLYLQGNFFCPLANYSSYANTTDYSLMGGATCINCLNSLVTTCGNSALGGTCNSLPGRPISCTCDAGHTGVSCQVPIHSCPTDDSTGDATWKAVNELTTATGTCKAGYTGSPTRQCLSGGTWGSTIGGTRCTASSSSSASVTAPGLVAAAVAVFAISMSV